MKNMWKERFENCDRILVRKVASKSHEMFSVLSEAFHAFAMTPHRTDTETGVLVLGPGLYKIVQEAPEAGYWAQGYRCETTVKVYTRGKSTFVKLVESKRLRVGETPDRDGFVVSQCVRGNNADHPASMEAKLIDWLRTKVEL